MINHKIGDVLAKKGDLQGAGEAYRASLVIAERLAAADPSNAQLQRDLSASQRKSATSSRIKATPRPRSLRTKHRLRSPSGWPPPIVRTRPFSATSR